MSSTSFKGHLDQSPAACGQHRECAPRLPGTTCLLLAIILALYSCASVEAVTVARANNLSYTGNINSIIPQPVLNGTYSLYGNTIIQYLGEGVLSDEGLGLLYATTTGVIEAGFGDSIKLVWMNYTAHPSQSPGLENYTTISQPIQVYVSSGTSASSAVDITANWSLTFLGNRIRSVLEQRGFYVEEVIANFWNNIGPPEDPQPAAVLDRVEILNRVELKGYNLLPFHFDKQMLMLATLKNMCLCGIAACLPISIGGNIPLTALNMSNWVAAEAATNSSRRLLANDVDTIYVDVWLHMNSQQKFVKPEVFWPLISSPNNTRIWEHTQAKGYPMNVTFLNATSYAWPTGSVKATITTSSAANTSALSLGLASNSTGVVIGASTKSSGIGPGGIAGITTASVLLLALGLGVLVLLARRKRQRTGTDKWLKLLAELNGAQERMDADDIKICKRADGSDWELGSGSFGKVFKGLRQGFQDVAVKKLTCTTASDVWLNLLMKEIVILKRASFDRNIVQYYGFCLDDEDSAMLVMEFLEGGTLQQALVSPKSHEYAWNNKGRRIALDIAHGMHFLHTVDIIHRDLKTSNILLSAEGVAKIADVGLAKMLTQAGEQSIDHVTGTFVYAAPEILVGDICTDKADVYSLGVVLWELVTHETPVRGFMRPLQPLDCPRDITDLISRCLLATPTERPSVGDIIDVLQGDTSPDYSALSSTS